MERLPTLSPLGQTQPAQKNRNHNKIAVFFVVGWRKKRFVWRLPTCLTLSQILTAARRASKGGVFKLSLALRAAIKTIGATPQ
jgi:hypothetical protein